MRIGNKNKRGRSNKEDSNQIRQSSKNDGLQRSAKGRLQTGNAPSNQQKSDRDPAERSGTSETHQHLKPIRTEERTFDILVDNVPYMVTATSFTFNEEARYRVSYNGSPEHVFTWDSDIGQLRAIDDDASTLPDNLEIAISEKLQS